MTLIDLFQRIGLSEKKAVEAAAHKTLAPKLELTIKQSGLLDSNKAVDVGKVGPLLFNLASNVTKNATQHLPYIAKAVADGRLVTSEQITAAIKLAEKSSGLQQMDDRLFDVECGVGVVVTHQEIKEGVQRLLQDRLEELTEKRYQLLTTLLGVLRTQLRWANTLSVKDELDRQLVQLLGPRDDRDDLKAKKKKEPKIVATASSASLSVSERRIEDVATSTKFIFEGELSKLHKAGENPQINPQLMTDHLKRTGGLVRTRFPPEPNGFLHIGHAKSINIDFGYAAAFGGVTFLRYDDTNPEAEEERYFTSILETLEWLGFTPNYITHSSDHFQRLFDLAVDLIKRDKAYVCHCTGEQIHQQRGGDSKGPRFDCPHRSRPISESVAEFLKMKDGKYKEGEAILRMKMDMQNPNPQFWDLVAYRVLFTSHHRTKDQWCIYPTYDYTHCLCDSFEDITHSICTTEFQMSRESYYWLVDALELYKPVQSEFGRLSLTNTVLSKRKLNKLVSDGIVSGWDDPRLYTLAALRRRGFTAASINAFVRELGVTTANTVIQITRLENYIREHLNQIAPRYFLILDPVKLTITNLPSDHLEEIEIPNKPREDSFGTRRVPFTRTVYIDRSDFREEKDPNFFRLTIGGYVGLLNVPFPVKATSVVKDSAGSIIEIKAELSNEATPKPKAFIQWVSESMKHNSPVKLTARLYDKLFLHENPQDKENVPGGWLSDINPASLEVVENAVADTGIRSLKIEDKFQAVRVAYFCVDKDSDLENGTLVINRTVSLKEDSKKDK